MRYIKTDWYQSHDTHASLLVQVDWHRLLVPVSGQCVWPSQFCRTTSSVNIRPSIRLADECVETSNFPEDCLQRLHLISFTFFPISNVDVQSYTRLRANVSWATRVYRRSPTCLIDKYLLHFTGTESTGGLMIRTLTHSTVDGRAFSVAAPRLWNDLHNDVISAESQQSSFRQLRKTVVFERSFPDAMYF